MNEQGNMHVYDLRKKLMNQFNSFSGNVKKKVYIERNIEKSGSKQVHLHIYFAIHNR
jgi:hypothetical protein